MIHPDTELQFINDKIGYGVVATKLIPKGTITWALDKLDRIFSPEEVRKLDPPYQACLTSTPTVIRKATIFYAGTMQGS
jgi:hypothetical protein